MLCRTDNSDSFNFRNFAACISQETLLIEMNLFSANSRNIFKSSSQTDGPGYIRSARLKFIREFLESCFFERYLIDHIASSLVGRHGIKEFLFTIKNPNTGRPKYLMP